MNKNTITLWLIALLLLSGCTKDVAPKIAETKIQKSYLDAGKRCPKNKEWTDENIAKWLNEPLERIWQVKIAKSLDNKALCQLSSKKLEHSFYRVDNPKRPDQPDHAVFFRAQQQSVNGVVKPDGLMIATEQREESILNTQISSSANIESGAYIDKDNWTELGPGNIGGRTRAIYIHPTDTNIIFIGSVGGGIWKSTDGGVSWSVVNDFMASIAITSIVADPRTTNNVNTTVLYASTGEGFYNADSLRGYGIFKSTDGGTTWSHLPSSSPALDSDWYYTNRLAINSAGVIIAVTRNNGIFTSNDDGNSWSKSAPGTYMEDVKFNPTDDTNAIVGSLGGNCYYTTDSGTTWTASNIVNATAIWISGRVELAYATDTNKVYASVDNNSGEIYSSEDGGITWTYLSTPSHLGNQGWYDNTIWVDPTDSSHLVIGGLDLHRSNDGGVTWTRISTWYYSSSIHADHHMIIHHPDYDGSTNKVVYFSNDGGIYKTEDITQVNSSSSDNGWINLNNDLSITQFYGAAGISGSNIIGGAQDNGALMQSNGTTWTENAGGDGGFSAVANNNLDPSKYYYFDEYTNLRIHRSDDGAPSVYIYNGISDSGDSDNANFIAPFILDPNNRNTMLAGGSSLWRSTNVTTADHVDVTWSSIKAGTGSRISQITIAQGNSDIILVGHNNGEVYKTTNGTDSSPIWTKVYDMNYKHVLTLLVDKDDTDILYAGWGGFSANNLSKSIDGGSTWSVISQDLPDAPMRSIVRHPTKTNFLYLGTEVGIFTSENQGVNWFTDNDGPANVSVDKLFWYDETTLVAGTHGRGMFKTTVSAPQSTGTNLPIIMYLLN